MTARLRWAAGLATLLVTACTIDVDFGGTRFKCSESPDCPSGQLCVAGFCERAGAIDAAAGDAPVGVDDAAPVDPDASSAGPDPRIGNLLDYSFDAIDDRHIVDSSGHRRDGVLASTVEVALDSVFGDALDFEGGSVYVPKDPALVEGPPITLEAWVRRDTADTVDTVFSDRDPSANPYVTYELALEPSPGGASFRTNAGCADTEVTVTSAASDVGAGVWAHLAVSWDGEVVRFYVDGTLTDSLELAATPCAAPGNRFRIGARSDGAEPFYGEIDELKLSSYVKVGEAISASMMHDAAAGGAVCGDRVVGGAEGCDFTTACCEAALCRYVDNGTACGEGTCQVGMCVVGGGRVADGLVALYEFDEVDGVTVADTSGVAPALDLTIDDALGVTWSAGTLTIDAPVVISSLGPATKIVTACQLSNELTMEAWVVPANLTQTGPARVVTMSIDTGTRNFQIGQRADRYQQRVRTKLSTFNATPETPSRAGDVATTLTHVVATRAANGERVLYVNGTPRDGNHVGGDFSTWDASYALLLANEVTANRAWLGTYHLVAIYNRALSAEEVGRNFTAGPD